MLLAASLVTHKLQGFLGSAAAQATRIGSENLTLGNRGWLGTDLWHGKSTKSNTLLARKSNRGGLCCLPNLRFYLCLEESPEILQTFIKKIHHVKNPKQIALFFPWISLFTSPETTAPLSAWLTLSLPERCSQSVYSYAKSHSKEK